MIEGVRLTFFKAFKISKFGAAGTRTCGRCAHLLTCCIGYHNCSSRNKLCNVLQSMIKWIATRFDVEWRVWCSRVAPPSYA